ncbi:hypothetical protein StoSoilB13_10840 [Arthrobacter sp. StoSoilB13]|nr:hypothetical protein StoSoilB13_10840 [Arthrobacter sp. StoSoilB13]
MVGRLRHRAHHDLVQVDVVRQRDCVLHDVGHVLCREGLFDSGVNLGGSVLVTQPVKGKFLGVDQAPALPR